LKRVPFFTLVWTASAQPAGHLRLLDDPPADIAMDDPTASLDPDALVGRAIERTGLDDFGTGPWRDGLQVLTESLDADAALNDIGVMTWDQTISTLLANRLRIEETYRQHPEIEAEALPAPIWIVGIPRTGTTALSSLLAQDSDLRALRTWEAVSPCPPPERATEHSDPRIAAAQATVDMMLQVEPALETMHEVDPRGPAENHDLHGLTFRTHAFDGISRNPRYHDWWTAQDLTPAFEYQRRVAKLLQWRCPPNRWHFKSPPDLFALDVIRSVYPGARIIWTHRDPTKALASISSFEAHLWRMCSDEIDFADVGPHLLDVWCDGTERAIQARQHLGDEVVLDISFSEFRDDQLGVVSRIYEWLDLELTGPTKDRMSTWLDEHPPGKHGEHRYSLEQFGLDEHRVDEAMAHYTSRFADQL
jgi:hypothetical protein